MNSFFCDFTKRDDRILVTITVDRQFGTPRNLTCALRRKEHQIKTVRNLVNAIFNGHACHRAAPIA